MFEIKINYSLYILIYHLCEQVNNGEDIFIFFSLVVFINVREKKGCHFEITLAKMKISGLQINTRLIH